MLSAPTTQKMWQTAGAILKPCLMITLISVAFFCAYSALVYKLTGFTVDNFLPGYSDMSDYYLEIHTAIEQGIFSQSAGYNGYIWNGSPAHANILYFGAHGLFSILPYILVGKLIGWYGATPLWAHLILISLSFLAIYYCTRSYRKTALIAVLALSFAPFLTYFPSMMIEIEMYAAGICCVALTVAFIQKRSAGRPSRYIHTALLLMIITSAALRVTNIVFLIPYFIYAMLTKSKRQYILAALTIASCAALYLVNAQMSASYDPSFLSDLLSAFSAGNLHEGFLLFGNHFFVSLKRYIYPADPFYTYVRYAVAGLGIGLLAYGARTLRTDLRGADDPDTKLRATAELGSGAMLLAIALLNILFYDIFDGRDFRVMVPVLLSAVIMQICVARGDSIKELLRSHKVLLCIITCIFSCAFYGQAITTITSDGSNTKFGEFPHHQYSQVMQYLPETSNRYENTVLIHGFYSVPIDFQPGLGHLTAFSDFTAEMPAGLGIRYILIADNYEPAQIDSYYQLALQEGGSKLYVLRGSA